LDQTNVIICWQHTGFQSIINTLYQRIDQPCHSTVNWYLYDYSTVLTLENYDSECPKLVRKSNGVFANDIFNESFTLIGEVQVQFPNGPNRQFNDQLGPGINWSQDIRTFFLSAVASIPDVGKMLSSIISILWSAPSPWQQVQNEVNQLINNAILIENYNSAIGKLNDLQNNNAIFLASPKGVTDYQIITSIYASVESTFQPLGPTTDPSRQMVSQFQFLPLFVQYANLFLLLFRSYAIIDPNQKANLTLFITNFTNYVVDTYNSGIFILTSNPAVFFNDPNITSIDFNILNSIQRSYQQQVLDYQITWIYLDITLYPDGQEITSEIFTSATDIYYTASELIPGTFSGFPLNLFDLPVPGLIFDNSNLSEIGIVSQIQTDSSNYANTVLGSAVKYSDTTVSGYSGIDLNKLIMGAPVITAVPIPPNLPIRQVSLYYAPSYIYRINFIYSDKSEFPTFIPNPIDTGDGIYSPLKRPTYRSIPATVDENYNLSNVFSSNYPTYVGPSEIFESETIYPYQNIWVDQATPDMLFGFRYQPKSIILPLPLVGFTGLTESQAHSLYTSSSTILDLTLPGLIQFIPIALEQQWEQQRLQYIDQLADIILHPLPTGPVGLTGCSDTITHIFSTCFSGDSIC
jgi:hypothetical protein